MVLPAALTATTTATSPAWFGLIDLEHPTAVVLAIQSRDSRLGFLVRADLDEAEAFAVAGPS